MILVFLILIGLFIQGEFLSWDVEIFQYASYKKMFTRKTFHFQGREPTSQKFKLHSEGGGKRL